MIRRLAKLRRDTKALSPIFAVLLFIAIAVIAGIIIYMFTSGYMSSMMGGGTTGQEKVAVEAVVWDGTVLAALAENTGGAPDVIITSVILRDSTGNALGQTPVTTPLAAGSLVSVTATPLTGLLTPGETYTLALVSTNGNQFVSPSFLA